MKLNFGKFRCTEPSDKTYKWLRLIEADDISAAMLLQQGTFGFRNPIDLKPGKIYRVYVQILEDD